MPPKVPGRYHLSRAIVARRCRCGDASSSRPQAGQDDTFILGDNERFLNQRTAPMSPAGSRAFLIFAADSINTDRGDDVLQLHDATRIALYVYRMCKSRLDP